jgi:hypothetical protein
MPMLVELRAANWRVPPILLNSAGQQMLALGQIRSCGFDRSMSGCSATSGPTHFTVQGRKSADFVAEVRCKLFWSVIPSL